MAVKNVAQT
jgi:hypothetical protein